MGFLLIPLDDAVSWLFLLLLVMEGIVREASGSSSKKSIVDWIENDAFQFRRGQLEHSEVLARQDVPLRLRLDAHLLRIV